MHWDWERFPGSNINAPDCALDTHWLTDSPPIATDKCKLSLNSVNCKYVNSKLRDFQQLVSNVLTDADESHHRYRQRCSVISVLVIFARKHFTIMSQSKYLAINQLKLQYRVYLPRYTTLFITNDYFANSRTDAWQLQCVQPSDTRWQPGWPAWAGQVKLTRIWVTRCTSACSHADTGEARRHQTDRHLRWGSNGVTPLKSFRLANQISRCFNLHPIFHFDTDQLI